MRLGVPGAQLVPTLGYLASLRVLRDLMLQGWALGTDEDDLFLVPSLTEPDYIPRHNESDHSTDITAYCRDRRLWPRLKWQR